jgi:hypothetical protein
MTRRSRRILLWLAVAAGHGLLGGPAAAEEGSPFAKLAGRWLGEGRLGVREGKTETVKCRVTYVLLEQGGQVRQTIRCASDSGNVEVQSVATHAGGALTGTWKELSRNMSGELSGSVTETGFKVAIRGAELKANMSIIVKDARQIIEIQFIDSALIGLTLVLSKG